MCTSPFTASVLWREDAQDNEFDNIPINSSTFYHTIPDSEVFLIEI